MTSFARLPFETFLQIAQQVSIADLIQSSKKNADYPSGFHVANLARPTLHSLLFVKPFSPAAQCVLNESVILVGPNTNGSRKLDATNHLIARILNAKCGLRRQIRELVVSDWNYAPYITATADVDSKYLENITFAVKDLRVLKTPKLGGLGVEWEKDNLRRLNVKFPRLRELLIDFDLKTESWPLDSFAALAKFASLEDLTVRVILPTPMFRQGPPQEAFCHKMASNLFKDFFVQNPDAKLRALHLTVLRWVPIPIQDYILHTVVVDVKRSKGDDQTSPLDGGFDVYISNGRGGEVGEENRSINRFLGVRD